MTQSPDGNFGELDLLHVDGTDVGRCDTMLRLGKQLFESGTWFDTPKAVKAREVVSTDPDHWGVSIKFRYDPELFDGIRYLGGIRILKADHSPARDGSVSRYCHRGDRNRR